MPTAKDLINLLVASVLVVLWAALGYFVISGDWWAATNIGSLVWSAGWRFGAACGLFWITLEDIGR